MKLKSGMRLATYLLLVITVSSCAAQTTRQSGPTDEETATNRARPFVEGQAALAKYRSATDCTNLHAPAVQKNISELQESVRLFHTVRMRSYEAEARERHTALSFGFADEALTKRCLDEANKIYRDLMTFYTGASYAGIRDRAKIGIDDVRAARSKN